METPYIASSSIIVNTTPAKIWEVLTKTSYIKLWDDVPDEFEQEEIAMDSQLVWDMEDGKYTKLTVIDFEPHRFLQMSLNISTWPQNLAPQDISYSYLITQQGDTSTLSISVGDFALLPKGKIYYEATADFLESTIQKIKNLLD